MEFLKKWGVYILLCLVGAIAALLFIIAECKVSSSLLRVIYGFLTLLPVGAMLPYLIKKGIDKGKEER